MYTGIYRNSVIKKRLLRTKHAHCERGLLYAIVSALIAGQFRKYMCLLYNARILSNLVRQVAPFRYPLINVEMLFWIDLF